MPTKHSPLQIAAVNGKTTAGAMVAAVAYLLNQLVVPLLDGADFAGLITPEVLSVALSLITAAGIAFSGIFTRDADKSSQDNEVRKPIEAVIDAKVEATVDEALGRK